MSTPETQTAPEPAIQRGARLLAAGDADGAVAVLRGLVAEAPVYAAAHVLLAEALDAAGRPDEGLDAWHLAAFLVPSSRLIQRKRLRLPDPDVAASPEESSAPEPTQPEVEPATSAVDSIPVAVTPSEPEPVAAPVQEPPPDAFADALTETPTVDAASPTADADREPVPVITPADAFGDAPEHAFPDEARVASPDELFSEIPADLDLADTAASDPGPDELETPTADATPGTEADPVTPTGDGPTTAEPPYPPPTHGSLDWGDLDDFAVSVLPPGAPDDAPPPSHSDPGGWAVLAERERRAPTPRGVVPPVISPEVWTPPDEPEPVRLSGAPSTPTRPGASARPSEPAATATSALDPASAAAAAPQAPVSDGETSEFAPPHVPQPEPALADDLDALIESLDAAPRITPDPDFDGPSPERSDDTVDDIASETLAKIYAAQHQYAEAAVVYERLAARAPERAEDLLARAAEMRRSAP